MGEKDRIGVHVGFKGRRKTNRLVKIGEEKPALAWGGN